MITSHLIQEKDTENICPYCWRPLSENWESEFQFDKHYKTTVCECGKKVTVRVNFFGSGHDYWHKKNITSLEGMIKELKHENGERKDSKGNK